MKKDEIKKLEKRILINDMLVIIFIGALLNMGVMINNNGKMPVYFHEDENMPIVDDTYKTFTDFKQVKYPYFSDIIKLNTKNYIFKFSIGDFLMFGGLIYLMFILLYNPIKNLKRRLKWRY